MDDSASSTSDSDSDVENLRGGRKRRIVWSSSSSESSDSDIAPRRLISHRKRTRVSPCDSDGPAFREPQNVIPETESENSNSFEGSFDSAASSDVDDVVAFRFSTMGRSSHVILDSDSSSSSSIGNEDVTRSPKKSAVQTKEAAAVNSESSDSGDESTEKCAICLRRMKDQEVGTPEGCDHTYCLTCLLQWSKASNKCPMDRLPFSIILVRENKELQVVRKITVKEPTANVVDDEYFIFCWVCGQNDRDAEMLLCDGCDRGFHLDCLNPPLTAVPESEEWYCPDCAPNQQGDADSDDFRLLNEDEERETPGRTRGRRSGGAASFRRRHQLRAPATRSAASDRPFDLLHSDLYQHLVHFVNFAQPSSAPGQSSTSVAVSIAGTSGTQRAGTSRRTTTSRGRTYTKRTTTRTKKTVKRKKRKTVRRRYTVRKKKVKIVNDDGTITEEIVEVRKAVRRRRKKKKIIKKKTRVGSRTARCPTVPAPPKTVRGRLARTLGMVTRTIPGQLVPQVSRPRTAVVNTRVNAPRMRAGIPTLHIFGPRDELAPVSSGSDGDDEGGVATMARPRTGISSRARDRSKAIELMNAPRRAVQIQPAQASDGPVDLLGSILESQAIWHSKKTDVTIKNDGTVVVKPSERVNVRDAAPERVATHAPIYPSPSGTQPPGSFSTNRPQSSSPMNQNNNASYSSPGGSQGRFGAARNDREGYTHFFNNMSGRPTPFCRGGPPLRFRMPSRPQLRRIPLFPRPNRPLWQQDDLEEPDENEGDEGGQEKSTDVDSKPGDDDVDLYSDIEPNHTEKADGEDGEEIDIPLLGPPPEPPAFLLGFGEGEDGKNNESDVYDPAEPCDSDEEMVIDVGTTGQQRLPTPPPPPTISASPPQGADSADEECPILSLYSTESLEHSRMGEEERARDFNDSKNQREELVDSIPSSPPPSPKSPEKQKELVGTRLSFNVEPNQEDSQDSSHDSVHSKSPEYEEAGEKPDENAWPRDTSPSTSRAGSKSPQPSLHPSSPSIASDLHNISGELSQDPPEKPDEEEGSCPRVTTGLEGLDVEEVSSENDFNDKCSISSFSAVSNRSRSNSPAGKRKKRKKKRQKVKSKRASEEGEINSDTEKPKSMSNNLDNISGDENKIDSDKKKKRKSSRSPERRVLGSKENKKPGKGNKDLSWKKPSKKDKNFREGRKTSKERDKSRERRSSRSASPKKDKKKLKDKKKTDKDKKKEIERYDVRKVVKNKETNERKTDEFGRDLPSKSLSLSRSRSPSKPRERPKRRKSRSPSKSPARGLRRGRSPARRRFRSRSRSTSSPRRIKKKTKVSPRKGENKSGARRSRSRSARRNVRRKKARSPSFSPSPMRVRRSLSPIRPRRSPSPNIRPRRSPSPTIRPRRSPSPNIRPRRSPSPNNRVRRNFSRSWSRHASPTPRDPSLEKLTVVLTAKEKKKRKKKRDEKRKRVEKKKSGNSKEVFASGDNVLVSVNFNRTLTEEVPVVSVSPVREVAVKKKKRTVDQVGRVSKKAKNTPVTRTIVDAALTQTKKAKKLTRLNEKEAEIILNRKPVAVIDLDMSPYREQTPSPVNVVVVSDSGSGEEGKAPSPNCIRISPSVEVTAPLSASTSGPYITSTGPKTPPEPPVKFTLLKPQQILRPIVNPLADGDDDDDPEDDEIQSSRQDNEEEIIKEPIHKGPNTPPEPRPTTPKTTPSPHSSPDAYDPFEPTKSRSPSPTQEAANDSHDNGEVLAAVEGAPSTTLVVIEDGVHPEKNDLPETMDVSEPDIVEIAPSSDSTEVISSLSLKPVASLMKKTVSQSTNATAPSVFTLSSPNKTQNRQTNVPMTGIQRLQHRLGSPVNKTPNSIKTTPEKRGPELLSTGNFKIRNAAAKRNGDTKPRPLQDATNETVIDMDDSPYSPASSEGDDLFDPPADPIKPSKLASALPYKPNKATPLKTASKFDLLFGSSGPTISPMKNGKKKNKGTLGKTSKKGSNKGLKKGIALKMDEDQLRILDELPSSAVELQVKDKFLKKLNRQERVVDEVKTVLKPHYARKHITKEEYKDILRRAVPKICHSKSGEINPSKIQHLVEAYVRKYRHVKKKTTGVNQKPKMKKTTMFS